MLNKLKSILKNPLRLTLKLFILVWFFLALNIILKVTFNYWQPYVIPTPQLELISNFIDRNKWLVDILNYFTYMFNGFIIMLCSIYSWRFNSKKQFLFVGVILTLVYASVVFIGQSDIVTLVVTFGLPLLLNRKHILLTLIYTTITFVLSNLFLGFSLFLNGNNNTDEMPYIIYLLFTSDYYIMLILKYISINLAARAVEKKMASKQVKEA